MAGTRRRFGGLRQLPSKRWQANYTGPNGVLYKAPKTFSAKINAEGWLADEARLIDLGLWSPPAERALLEERAKGTTFGVYAERWIGERPLRPRTKNLYRSQLDRLILPTFDNRQLAGITTQDVRTWLAGLDEGNPRQNQQTYQLFKTILGTANDDKLITENPANVRGMSKVSRKRSIRVLNPNDIERLADAMAPESRASVLVAAWCGLRWGELSELRRADVATDGAAVTVSRGVVYDTASKAFNVGEPKTAAGRRRIVVPPHVREALSKHLDEHVGPERDALLFPAPGGGHQTNDRYAYHLSRAAAAVGIEGVTPHVLRHSGATLAAQAGATVAELMGRIGHTSPAMALRYQHIASERDAEIAAAMSSRVQSKTAKAGRDKKGGKKKVVTA